MPTPSIVALIPARAGSVRIKDKNIRPLAGKPLISYTIAAARQSGVFAQVVVSTDSEEYAAIARRYGAETSIRPAALATATAPDYDWVRSTLLDRGIDAGCFSILRPTSPFRLPTTIQRAVNQWRRHGRRVDSLRAAEPVDQHPGKMWRVLSSTVMVPLLPFSNGAVPWHSSQTAALPELAVQNASLEIAWVRVVFERATIAGDVVMPFWTQGYEGHDLNEPDDWDYAEWLVQTGRARLPEVTCA